MAILQLFIALLICYVSFSAGFSLNMKQFTRNEVLAPFQFGNALKIISGLHNFDQELVKNVAYAANNGGASHIDIACKPELVKIAKSVAKNIPVCVSSVVPSDFVEAVAAGADMVEIGNYDSFYDKGVSFSAEDIIKMTKEARHLLPFTVLSVTVPHNLPLPQQILLAKELEACGADIIQTEGKVSATMGETKGVQELIEMSVPALSSAYSLSRAVNIPVMCSSGLTDVTASLALSVGAKGVGIGSMVNKLKHPHQMLMAVSAIASAMGRDTSYSDDNNSDEISYSAQKTAVSSIGHQMA